MECCDLLIVGSGPAGMSAAINGASEGINVCLLDAAPTLGGQARESSAIENYPGFPHGITGANLMAAFASQAIKFKTRLHCPVNAQALERMDDGFIKITADDYSEYKTRTVLLALGLSYRRLNIPNIARLMGNGVWYGLPPLADNGRKPKKVAVIGGANSAGQAVIKLASNPRTSVMLIIRRRITDQMSTYLIDRIREMHNVKVMELTEVELLHGTERLSAITTKEGEVIELDGMHIFIGAIPKTLWLRGRVSMDDKGFINTWTDLPEQKDHLPYETSMKGVFAAGDVRNGSIKRIASAIGEGAAALQMIHRRL